MSFRFRVPEVGLSEIGCQDVATSVLVLGLPQAALTLGNAIVATVARWTIALLSSSSVFVRCTEATPQVRFATPTISADH